MSAWNLDYLGLLFTRKRTRAHPELLPRRAAPSRTRVSKTLPRFFAHLALSILYKTCNSTEADSPHQAFFPRRSWSG